MKSWTSSKPRASFSGADFVEPVLHVVVHPEKQCALHFTDEVKSLFVASDFPELSEEASKIESHLSTGGSYAELEINFIHAQQFKPTIYLKG